MSVTELASDNWMQRRTVHQAGEPYLTIAAGHAPRAEIHPHPLARSTRSSLFVRRLQFDACIGVYDWEKARRQPVVIDLEFGLATELACHTDRIGDAIDYAEVVTRLRELATERHYELVEALAETMAFMLQRDFGVPWLVLTLSKLAPFPGAEVGIVIERGQRT